VTVATRFRDLWRFTIGRTKTAERWVVVDTETTGLDADNDRLLAIGAVAVDRAGICLADSFEVLVQNLAPGDKDNVVIHGIGYEAQREGMPIPQALAAFAAYVAGAPCVGFHCPFDRAVLARSASSARVSLSLPRWLDLDPLAAALVPDAYQRGARSLDDIHSRCIGSEGPREQHHDRSELDLHYCGGKQLVPMHDLAEHSDT